MGEYSISVSWYVSDIKNVDEKLTDEQCKKVLDYIYVTHNAEIGINWDVIQCAIDDVIGNGEDEKQIGE